MTHCLWCGVSFTPPIRWSTLFELRATEGYCKKCQRKLAPLLHSAALCRLCGRSLDALEPRYVAGDMCSDCQQWEAGEWRGVLEKNRSLYSYNSFLKELMTQFKFRGDAALIKGFKDDLQRLYHRFFKNYLPVPIPISPSRMQERAFNQALLMAELLPVEPVPVLQRTFQNQKQSKKTKSERLQTIQNPFTLAEKQASDVMNRPIVLVDDIYTTGSTVRQAALALQELHPSRIASMTLAR
ncbi:competence protein ComFC [Pullulanibacillus pueri]|uniref:Amidophosphoribosyltransferase n=1 Tax=Pullulanibacillus pueri TaxID=1437324 RepID=A0A8J2ZTK2_9BACL|nr:ComF family protein [Pullulanibacillus pueri]MBM7684120.1 competence protein ComFC [Pullulanibacillus pueri]GGH76688.1 amidophosphoribosyltransferase [Pullulanibacillus pueri]